MAYRDAETRRIAQRAYRKRWREAHPEKAREKYRRDSQVFREKNPEYYKNWCAAHPEIVRRCMRRWREANWFKKMLSGARSSAKQRGHGMTLTEDDLQALVFAQKGLCYWTHVPMLRQSSSPWTMTIDRLDNSKGYEPGNVVLASWFANHARGDLSVEEFRTVLAVVAALAKK